MNLCIMRFSPTKDQFVYYTFAAMIAGLPFSKALSSVALTILLFLAFASGSAPLPGLTILPRHPT